MIAQLIAVGVFASAPASGVTYPTPSATWVWLSNDRTIKLKFASEVLLRGIDFTSRLSAGETLTGTPVVTCGDQVTADAVQLIGNVVAFRLSGGTAPQYATLSCLAMTSEGETLEAEMVLTVVT